MQCSIELLEENKKVEEGKRHRVQWLKNVRENRIKNDLGFDDYFKREENIVFENLFFKKHPEGRSNWLKHRHRCRFLEQYAKAFTTLVFLAQNDHQLKIDRNDRNDAEQLSFLLYADILVSDDEKYMKKSFDLLYKETNKRFLKLDQFLSFIHSIN